MIDGAHLKELKTIQDERGRLMEMLRADDPFFTGFGQVYLTTTNPGVVKAWHYHKDQSDNAVCIKGAIKLVMFDPREESPTKGDLDVIYMGEHQPRLLHIPKGVYHGWMCVSPGEAVIINTVDKTYQYDDPDEHRIPPHDNDEIDYDWTRKDG